MDPVAYFIAAIVVFVGAVITLGMDEGQQATQDESIDDWCDRQW